MQHDISFRETPLSVSGPVSAETGDDVSNSTGEKFLSDVFPPRFHFLFLGDGIVTVK